MRTPIRIDTLGRARVRRPATCHPTRALVGRGLCRACYSRKWRNETPEKKRAASEASKAWQRANPEKAKEHHERANKKASERRKTDRSYLEHCVFRDLQKRYGVTKERYNEMLSQQNGRCAICRSSEPGMKRGFFAVDHDHKTGKVRALLCLSCNVGLGSFKEDIAVLSAAIFYLEKMR